VTFIRHSPELKTAYHDTLGDLALGLAGSVAASVAVAWLGQRPGYFRSESAAPAARSAMPGSRGQ
jgi:hypothetical protein